jgi:hypothetical protein
LQRIFITIGWSTAQVCVENLLNKKVPQHVEWISSLSVMCVSL